MCLPLCKWKNTPKCAWTRSRLIWLNFISQKVLICSEVSSYQKFNLYLFLNLITKGFRTLWTSTFKSQYFHWWKLLFNLWHFSNQLSFISFVITQSMMPFRQPEVNAKMVFKKLNLNMIQTQKKTLGILVSNINHNHDQHCNVHTKAVNEFCAINWQNIIIIILMFKIQNNHDHHCTQESVNPCAKELARRSSWRRPITTTCRFWSQTQLYNCNDKLTQMKQTMWNRHTQSQACGDARQTLQSSFHIGQTKFLEPAHHNQVQILKPDYGQSYVKCKTNRTHIYVTTTCRLWS